MFKWFFSIIFIAIVVAAIGSKNLLLILITIGMLFSYRFFFGKWPKIKKF